MNYNFYLVDDDVSVLSILTKIIVNEKCGDVVGKTTFGNIALDEILKIKPDIVIVDLLLPKIDGITLVSKLKPLLPEVPFIMISEVFAKDMVSKAYNSGVSFFINKPINVIEVINVLKRVDENLKMKKVISSFHQAFQNFQSLDNHEVIFSNESPDQSAKDILNDIGILSEAGCKDILNILAFLNDRANFKGQSMPDFKLNDLYGYLSDKYSRESGESIHAKTIEQRVRRAIGEGLVNLSAMALDDYDHFVFEKYASILYDFKDVRKEIAYMKKQSKERGKVSIKKFIIGMLNEMNKNK